MQQIKHLDHLNLSVHNLQESITWYQQVFGFQYVEGGTNHGIKWAIVRSGEAMLCMYECPEHESPTPHQDNTLQIHHFAFRIEDEQQWCETLHKYNIPLDYGDGVIEYPHSKSWYVADPSGYQIEVVLWNQDTISFAS